MTPKYLKNVEFTTANYFHNYFYEFKLICHMKLQFKLSKKCMRVHEIFFSLVAQCYT